MQSDLIASRLCYIASAIAPTDCAVVLHARDMNALEMANCIGLDVFGAANILGICPASIDPFSWSYEQGSADVEWLDAFSQAIRLQYPSIERVHLIGFSNGGEAAGAVALFGSGNYASYMQVCATRRTSQSGYITDLGGAPVQLLLGTLDPRVPIAGNAECISADAAQALYEAVGATVTVGTFNAGHCWPGGIAPPGWMSDCFDMGPWGTSPPLQAATQLAIASIQAIASQIKTQV